MHNKRASTPFNNIWIVIIALLIVMILAIIALRAIGTNFLTIPGL